MFTITADLPGSGGSCTTQWSGCLGADCCPVSPQQSAAAAAAAVPWPCQMVVMEVSLVLDEAQEVTVAWQAVMAVDLAARLVPVVLRVAAALATPPAVVVASVVEESAQAAMEVAASICLSPPGTTPNKELASSPATPGNLSSSAPPANQHFQEGSFLGLEGWKPWLFP